MQSGHGNRCYQQRQSIGNMADGDKISQWAILASVVSTGEGETITVNITRFVLAFSILLIVFFVHNCLSHTLSALPSIHWSAPWCRVFILWQVYLDRRRLAHYAGHMSKAGRILPVIRVAPNEVSIMTTAGLDVVYKGAFDRSSHYSVFQNYGYGATQWLSYSSLLIRLS